VALLAAGAVTWAALPMSGARAGARLALIAAIGCAAASMVCMVASVARDRPDTQRLEVGADGFRSPYGYHSRTGPVRLRLWQAINVFPWAQGMTIGVLALEALHRSRPWHTVVLGVVVLGYLLSLHLAESAARPAVLRPQLPLIVVGICLAGLSVGAAMIPATSSGAGWLSVVAAIAALMVAALALPV
jgi:hypothetical protein